MCRAWRLVCCAIVAMLASGGSRVVRADEFFLRDGHRVLFFGDSITQGGAYVQMIDALLTSRFPEQSFELINHGISSETISGTSEVDHTPRRPDAHLRFARDVAAWRPDVIVACFGMNDGNYHSFEPERFAAYQTGVRRLLQRAASEAGGAQVVLLTPPPYDPYYRRASDPEAKYYGYKFAAIDYDHTLAKYAEWLLSLATPEQQVIDLHTALNRHVAARRKQLASYTISPDAIHPNLTGHWLMAQQVLRAWHLPEHADRAQLDAAALTVASGQVSELRRDGPAWRFQWRVRLPFHFDEQIDRGSLAFEESQRRLNALWLEVDALPAGRYQLLVGNRLLGKLTAEQLAQGVDLCQFAELPTHERSKRVWELTRERHRSMYAEWRKRIAAREPAANDDARRLRPADDLRWQALRTAAAPVTLDVHLRPAME